MRLSVYHRQRIIPFEELTWVFGRSMSKPSHRELKWQPNFSSLKPSIPISTKSYTLNSSPLYIFSFYPFQLENLNQIYFFFLDLIYFMNKVTDSKIKSRLLITRKKRKNKESVCIWFWVRSDFCILSWSFPWHLRLCTSFTMQIGKLYVFCEFWMVKLYLTYK